MHAADWKQGQPICVQTVLLLLLDADGGHAGDVTASPQHQ
jgi:hypothetical protein